jgi:integrase
MKIDPYKHEVTFLSWKKKVKNGIPGISRANSDVIHRYIADMEMGLNVSASSPKGSRSYARLNGLRQRLVYLAAQWEQRLKVTVTEVTEEQLMDFFNSMRNGTIRKQNGGQYKSVVDYVKAFKAFWHWHMKVSRKRDRQVKDITEDLDASRAKPRWVYLSEDDVRRLCDEARPDYRVLIMFLYDSGVRSPSELINIRVSDLYGDCKELHIRDAITKKGSFGRKISLMLCSGLLKRHIANNGLEDEDQLFAISPSVVNRYLQRLAGRVLGQGVSLADEKYSNLTMYDFRHCSCCYWLPRYKSESALRYRFGWRKSDKIDYYSELLGMKDTITQEDMLVGTTKTDIERRLLGTEQENAILKQRLEGYDRELVKLRDLMRTYVARLKELDHFSACAGRPVTQQISLALRTKTMQPPSYGILAGTLGKSPKS